MSKEYLQYVVLENKWIQSSTILVSIVQSALHSNTNTNYHNHNHNNNNNSNVNNNNNNSSNFKIIDNQVYLLDLNDISHPLRKSIRCSISLSNRIPLLFSHPGDSNGLFSYLSKKHSSSSSSPSSISSSSSSSSIVPDIIKVTSSSPVSRYTNPNVLISKTYVTTNYTTGRPPWFKVEIIGMKSNLVLNYYAIRQDGSDSFLRNWRLEGAQDEQGQEWNVLEEYENDWSIGAPGEWKAWSVRSGKPWKWFRIVMTGPTSNEYDKNKMSMCGLELYGYFKEF